MTLDEQIVVLYSRGMSATAVAEKTGAKRHYVYRVLKRAGITRRAGYQHGFPSEHQKPDYGSYIPSKEEIRQKCAEIQDSWDEYTESLRRSVNRKSWEPKQVIVLLPRQSSPQTE